MKSSTTKKRLFGVLLALLTVMSMLIPAGAVQAAAKPKVKVTTSMSASNKLYMGTNKALNVKTSTPSTVTYKTSNSSIAAVKSGKLCAYKPGSVTVKVSAKPKSGKYQTGTVTFKVDVLPKKPGTPSASRSGGKINVNMIESKGATGYQFVYATNSEFSGYKKITTPKPFCSFSSSDSKTYYVKARSYAAVNGKNYYSDWSPVHKVNKGKPTIPSDVKIKEIDLGSSPLTFHSIHENPYQIRILNIKASSHDDPYFNWYAIKYLVWKSSNPKIADITSSDEYGAYIKPVSVGTCTITASSPDGKVSDSVKVTVKEDIKSITLSENRNENSAKSSVLVNKNDVLQLEAFVPSYNTNDPYNDCPVKWKCSNPNVVSIEKNYNNLYALSRNIKPKANGTCTITVYSEYNPSVKDTFNVTVNFINGSADPSHPYIKDMFDRVNKERMQAGVPKVVLDEKMTSAAMVRAKEIVTHFGHTRPDGRPCFTALDEAGVHYGAAGENAFESSGYPFHAMNMVLSSPPHKANMLNPIYGRIGVGLYVMPDGSQYWIQIFTD